jgi:hypothetical protein
MHNSRILTYLGANNMSAAFSAIQDKIDAGYEIGQPMFRTITDHCSVNSTVVDAAYFAVDDLRKAGRAVDLDLLNIILAATAQMRDINRAQETFAGKSRQYCCF